MSKVTKKQKIILEKVDPEKIYSISEALEIMQSVRSPKFEESIDIAIRLGVDPNKSDQNVRGAVTLPNSLGKAVSVAVFADGDQADAAKAAGAEYIGMDDLADKFSKEEISVDVVISSNDAMKVVGKLGQVLGPKGLMPNPKTGTVTDDVATAINNAIAHKVSAGGVEVIKLFHVTNLVNCLKFLSEKNVNIYGLSEHASESYYESDFVPSTAIIMGAEESGIREKTLERCDYKINLSGNKLFKSFNVSVATGIILSEANRQRQNK
ncbi:hypothetical protein N9S06_04515 [Gammaproteobacteria bacterium]|nr:hypothetical protein [Gammaproteobacteria bacterium]